MATTAADVSIDTIADWGESGMHEWWRLMEERGTRRDRPMKPQVIAWELGNSR